MEADEEAPEEDASESAKSPTRSQEPSASRSINKSRETTKSSNPVTFDPKDQDGVLRASSMRAITEETLNPTSRRTLRSKGRSQTDQGTTDSKLLPKSKTSTRALVKNQNRLREMIGQREVKNEKLDKQKGDLRQRLDLLEFSVPAVMVWNIWRMAQGAPVSSLRRVMKRQFLGPASGEQYCANTPSRHYDCRVREAEADRKQAERRAEEARSVLTDKQALLNEKKQKLEEAKRIQQERKEKIEELRKEAKELRAAMKELEVQQGHDGSCEAGECGDIECKRRLLAKMSGSGSSIRSSDVECLEKLQELAESELLMKKQIEELERREETYMKTLQQADDLWTKEDATSTVSALQEQLDEKNALNEQLELELERMKATSAVYRSELEKFVSVEKIEAAIGRDDDLALVSDKSVAAKVKLKHRITGSDTVDVSEKETLARIPGRDEGVSAVVPHSESATDRPDDLISREHARIGTKPEDFVLDERYREAIAYLDQLGSLSKLYEDDDYGICEPEYACQQEGGDTEDETVVSVTSLTPVTAESFHGKTSRDIGLAPPLASPEPEVADKKPKEDTSMPHLLGGADVEELEQLKAVRDVEEGVKVVEERRMKSEGGDEVTKGVDRIEETKSRDLTEGPRNRDVIEPRNRDVTEARSRDVTETRSRDVPEPAESKDITETARSRDATEARSRDVPEPAKSRDVLEATRSRDIPEAQRNRDVPEPAKSRDMPEAAKSREVTEAPRSTDVYEPAKSRDVPDPAKGRDVQDAPRSRDAPEVPRSRDISEPTKSRDVPEVPRSRDVSEPTRSRDVSEPAKSKDVPEAERSRDVPEAARSGDVPEAPRSRDVPEAARSGDVPEAPRSRDVPEAPRSRDVPELGKSRDVLEAAKSRDVTVPAISKDVIEPAISRDVPEVVKIRDITEAEKSRDVTEAETSRDLTETPKSRDIAEVVKSTDEIDEIEAIRDETEAERARDVIEAPRSKDVAEVDKGREEIEPVRDLDGGDAQPPRSRIDIVKPDQDSKGPSQRQLKSWLNTTNTIRDTLAGCPGCNSSLKDADNLAREIAAYTDDDLRDVRVERSPERERSEVSREPSTKVLESEATSAKELASPRESEKLAVEEERPAEELPVVQEEPPTEKEADAISAKTESPLEPPPTPTDVDAKLSVYSTPEEVVAKLEERMLSVPGVKEEVEPIETVPSTIKEEGALETVEAEAEVESLPSEEEPIGKEPLEIEEIVSLKELRKTPQLSKIEEEEESKYEIERVKESPSREPKIGPLLFSTEVAGKPYLSVADIEEEKQEPLEMEAVITCTCKPLEVPLRPERLVPEARLPEVPTEVLTMIEVTRTQITEKETVEILTQTSESVAIQTMPIQKIISRMEPPAISAVSEVTRLVGPIPTAVTRTVQDQSTITVTTIGMQTDPVASVQPLQKKSSRFRKEASTQHTPPPKSTKMTSSSPEELGSTHYVKDRHLGKNDCTCCVCGKSVSPRTQVRPEPPPKEVPLASRMPLTLLSSAAQGTSTRTDRETQHLRKSPPVKPTQPSVTPERDSSTSDTCSCGKYGKKVPCVVKRPKETKEQGSMAKLPKLKPMAKDRQRTRDAAKKDSSPSKDTSKATMSASEARPSLEGCICYETQSRDLGLPKRLVCRCGEPPKYTMQR